MSLATGLMLGLLFAQPAQIGEASETLPLDQWSYQCNEEVRPKICSAALVNSTGQVFTIAHSNSWNHLNVGLLVYTGVSWDVASDGVFSLVVKQKGKNPPPVRLNEIALKNDFSSVALDEATWINARSVEVDERILPTLKELPTCKKFRVGFFVLDGWEEKYGKSSKDSDLPFGWAFPCNGQEFSGAFKKLAADSSLQWVKDFAAGL